MKKVTNYSRFQALKKFDKGERKTAMGYCMLHDMYIHQKRFDKKNCNECKSYIVLNGLEDNNGKNN